MHASLGFEMWKSTEFDFLNLAWLLEIALGVVLRGR